MQQLRDVLGSRVSDQELTNLLDRADGNVERAIDLHFTGDVTGEANMQTSTRPPPAPRPTTARSRAGAAAGGARRRRAPREEEQEELDLTGEPDEQTNPQPYRGPASRAGQRQRAGQQPSKSDFIYLSSSSPSETSESTEEADKKQNGRGVAGLRMPVAVPSAEMSESGSDSDDGQAGNDSDYRPKRRAPAYRRPRMIVGRPRYAFVPALSSDDDEDTDDDIAGVDDPFVSNYSGPPLLVDELKENAGPLDPVTLCTAKARQPALPQPPSKLPLPLPQYRQPDSQGGKLFCEDAHQVPRGPVPNSMPVVNSSNGNGKARGGNGKKAGSNSSSRSSSDSGAAAVPPERATLGTICIPLLPATANNLHKGMSQVLLHNKQWWGSNSAAEATAGLRVMQKVLADGSVPLSSLTLLPATDGVQNPSYSTGHDFTSDLVGFAVGVLSDAKGFAEVEKLCLTYKVPIKRYESNKYSFTSNSYIRAAVLGYLPAEYLPLTRGLALLSEMHGLSPWRSPENYADKPLTCSITAVLGPKGTPLAQLPTWQPQPPSKDDEEAGTNQDDKKDADANADKAGKQPGATGAQKSSGKRPLEADDNTAAAQPANKKAKTSRTGRKATKTGGADEGGSKAAADGAKDAGGDDKTAAKPTTPRKAGRAGKKQPEGAVYVEITIQGDTAKLLETGAAAASLKKGSKAVTNASVTRAKSMALADILHSLLAWGRGLWIGADSDGLLNYDDHLAWGVNGTCKPDNKINNSNGEPADGTARQRRSNSGTTSTVVSVDSNACVGGLTIREHAALAGQELDHLRAQLAGSVTQERTFVGQLSRARANQSRASNANTGNGAPPPVARLHVPVTKADVWKAEARVAQARAHKRALEMAVSLAERAVTAFAAAGLCDPLPVPEAPGSFIADAAANTRDGSAGPSNAIPKPDDNTQAAEVVVGVDGEEATAQAQAATGSEQPPAATEKLSTIGEGCQGKTPGKGGKKASGNTPQKRGKTSGQAGLPDVLPWVPEVSLAMILAAEQASGKPLLERDATGWVRVAGMEEARGVISYKEKLRGHAFGVHALLDSVATPTDYPAAKSPDNLRTNPKAFQLQALSWMMAREQKSDALGRGVLSLHPEWLQLVTKDGWVFYISKHSPYPISSNFVAAPVMESTCGGFLCDEMGLGKSLESLMLITSNPPPEDWPVTASHHAPPDKNSPAVPIQTTLLVVPSNLIQQWQDEIQQHIQAGKLSWGVYDSLESASMGATVQLRQDDDNYDDDQADVNTGTRRTRARSTSMSGTDATVARRGRAFDQTIPFLTCRMPEKRNALAPISQLQLVLMSYEQLRKDLSSKCPLLNYGFWRIMLDEAQLVANSNSVAAGMSSSLWRRHAWVVTGTPISSRLSEVAGLCEFLDAQPFYQPTFWRSQLMTPYEGHTRAGLLAMRSLLSGLMLRRTKAQVESQLALPPCIHEDRQVTLSRVERAFYDQLLSDFRQAMKSLKAAQKTRHIDAPTRTSRLQKASSHVLSALTALRQCCCHPNIVKREAARSHNKKERASMRQIMGRLVMQAYSSLDAAMGQLYSARMLQSAIQALGYEVKPPAGGAGQQQASGSPEPSLLEMLVEIYANGELAEMYDLRSAAKQRGNGGLAVLNTELANQLVQANQDKLVSAQIALESGANASLAHFSLIEPPTGSLLLHDNNADVNADNNADNSAGNNADQQAAGGLPNGTSTEIQPAVQQEPRADGTGSVPQQEPRQGNEQQDMDVEEKEKEEPPFVIVCGPRDVRPYGLLPQPAFTSKEVYVALPGMDPVPPKKKDAKEQSKADAGGDSETADTKQDGASTSKSAASGKKDKKAVNKDEEEEEEVSEEELLRRAVQAEIDAEINAVKEAQRDRKRRWRRLECDVHVLQAYVLRRQKPECVVLAQQAESLSPLPPQQQQPKTEGTSNGGASTSAGPSQTTQGQFNASNGDVNMSNGEVKADQADVVPWGAGQESETRLAAVQLAASRQRLNALRLELGLEPVVDVDTAELRRSRRVPLKADAQEPQRKRVLAALTAKSDNDGGSDNDEDILLDDDDDETIGKKGGRKAKKRRTDAAKPAQPLTALEMFLRSEAVVRKLVQLLEAKDPLKSAMTDVQNAHKAMLKQYHELMHLLNREEEALASLKGEEQAAVGDSKAGTSNGKPTALDNGGVTSEDAMETDEKQTASPGDGAGPSNANGNEAKPGPSMLHTKNLGADAINSANALIKAALAEAENNTEKGVCPICLDVPERRVVTVCGHNFCSDCMTSMVSEAGRGVPCPICRHVLTKADVFETMSAAEEEAAAAERARELALQAAATTSHNEYGAKVAALLAELADMQSKDPGAKALVISSWGRLLRLVQDALQANGVAYASLAVNGGHARDQALLRFTHDPECKVLLLMMSTSGGAAGLTLTVASTAFILEPAISPGIEAQAAARIYRLGQQKTTRIIRLIAADTVEQAVIRLQRHKLSSQKAIRSSGGSRGQQPMQGRDASTSNVLSLIAAGRNNEDDDAVSEDDENIPIVQSNDLDTTTLTRFFADL